MAMARQLIPGFRKQRHVEFKASLVNRASSRTHRDAEKKPCL